MARIEIAVDTQRDGTDRGERKVTTCGLTCSMVGRWAVTDTPGAATRPSRTDSAISCDSAQARSPARPPRSESFSGACPDPREHHPCWPTEPTNQCALTCIFDTFTYAIVQGECLSLLASCWIEDFPLALGERVNGDARFVVKLPSDETIRAALIAEDIAAKRTDLIKYKHRFVLLVMPAYRS